MKTRQYESVVILNAALEDRQIEEATNRIKETVSVNGGEIFDIDIWGRKRLAYPIQKAKSGYYSIFYFNAPSDAIKKIERMYRLDEDIFRYLTIVLDKTDMANFEKKKADKALKEEQAKSAIEPEKEENANEPSEKEKPEDETSEDQK